MTLISLLVTIIVIGVLLWLVEAYVPMARPIKRILEAVVIIVLVLWLLQAFGLLGNISAIKVR